MNQKMVYKISNLIVYKNQPYAFQEQIVKHFIAFKAFQGEFPTPVYIVRYEGMTSNPIFEGKSRNCDRYFFFVSMNVKELH